MTMNRIATGEQTLSAEALVRDYGPIVSSLCRRMIRDAEEARDAAQEAWMEIVDSLPSFEGRARISTWIYAVASRVIRRYGQKERLYSIRFLREYFSGDDLPSPYEDDLERREWVKSMCDRCLVGTLQCLDRDARLAYLFRDVVELPYPEIARVMELEETTVRKMISRARKRLNHFLSDRCSLHNPGGACRCRMRRWVQEIDLPEEYEKIRASVRRVRVFKESDQILPRKNFWENLL